MLVASGQGAHAQVVAGTPAGTLIVNTAQAGGQVGAGTVSATSNTATLTVAERLDVTLAAGPAGDATPSAVVTNAGNGSEPMVVSAQDGDGADAALAADLDGDGRYDPATDLPLAGGTTPALAPGASIRLFILSRAQKLTLSVRAATGSGAPGTTFAGRGDDGSDAVVGPTGAAAALSLTPASADRAPTLTKSQAVAAGDGVARTGGVVTYTLVAAFPSARADARVEDAIPSGAAYVPGSLRLDGAALSDAADADAGAVTDGVAAVSLGDVPAGAAHTIAFKVTLK